MNRCLVSKTGFKGRRKQVIVASLTFSCSFLPGLAFLIFNIILYDYIITPLAKLEAHPSKLVTSRSIFNKVCTFDDHPLFLYFCHALFSLTVSCFQFFLFQVFNTFLGSVVANGIINVINDILANPTVIVRILADSVPTNWPTFVSIVMITGKTEGIRTCNNVGVGASLFFLSFFMQRLLARLPTCRISAALSCFMYIAGLPLARETSERPKI